MQVDAITHVLSFLTSVMISPVSTLFPFINHSTEFSFQLQTSVLMFNCLHFFVSGNSRERRWRSSSTEDARLDQIKGQP